MTAKEIQLATIDDEHMASKKPDRLLLLECSNNNQLGNKQIKIYHLGPQLSSFYCSTDDSNAAASINTHTRTRWQIGDEEVAGVSNNINQQS